MSRTHTQEKIYIKTADEIALMRESGRIVARAHEAMRDAVRPGVSTWELDHIAETVIRDHGAEPTFLNYPKLNSPNFPATITASINNELVHGIPSKTRILKQGDIISLDVGCLYQGFVGDSAYTWAVGEISSRTQNLLDVTQATLAAAIEASVLGHKVSDVAKATQDYAESRGYTVAREYTGHGVGRKMHEPPQVPNWWPRKKRQRSFIDCDLRVGMTFAIEPMLISGRSGLKELKDKWTVITKDKSMCAHFEHTIAITEGAPIILTLP